MKDQNLEKELKQMREELDQLKAKTWTSRLKQYSKLIQGILLGLSITAVVGIAGQISKTYTFSSGMAISSTEVNTNFDDLFDKVNDMNLGFIAELSTDQNKTCTDNTTFAAVEFDTLHSGDAGYNTGTYTYTVSVAGYYQVSYRLDSSHTMTYGQILLNGVVHYISTTEMIKLSVGDTLSMEVDCGTSMGPTSTITAAKSYFSVIKAF